jgi:hypothetical protein
MNALKLPLPSTGQPKSGLVQFGDGLPGVFISAEDAFVMRMLMQDVTDRALESVPLDISEDQVALAHDAIFEAADAMQKLSAQLSPLLAPITYGSAAHLKKTRESVPLKAAA